MNEADDASRGSAIKLGAEAAGRVVNVATTILIARSLSLGDFGAWNLASTAAVIAAEAADLGLQATAGRDLVTRRIALATVLRAKALLTVVATAALPLLWLLNRWTGLDVRLGLFAPLLLYYALSGWTELLGVALRVRGRPMQEAAVIFCFRATLCAAVAVIVARGPRLDALGWGHVASTLPALVLAGALVVAVREAGQPGPSVIALQRTAFPLGVNGALALLSVRVESLALGWWASERELGLFGAPQQLVLFLLVVPNAICAGAMPALTREATRRDGGVRERTASTLALLGVPAAAGLWLVPGVVEVLGGQFAEASGLLRIFAFAVPAVFLNALLHHTLIALGRGGRVARLTGARTAIALAAAFVLVPRAGATGAALGFVGAELAMLFLAGRGCVDAGLPVPVIAPLLRGAALTVPMAAVLAAVSLPLAHEIALGVAVYSATLGLAWWWRRTRRLPGDSR